MTVSALSARPRKPRPSWGLWVGLALALVITVLSGLLVEADFGPLFWNLGNGWFIIQEFLLPDWAFLGRTWAAWMETLFIAIVATAIGCTVALVAAMFASKVTMRHAAVIRIVKVALSIVRSLPDIGWALLFVALVGVGPLAGMIALVLLNLGIIAKLTGETIDAVDLGPVEAADASGASPVQRARWAVLPQILPNYASYCLYVFEINVRGSTVLGFVGAGGIGQTISVELARFNYDNVAAVVAALIAVVFVIDQASIQIRKRLI